MIKKRLILLLIFSLYVVCFAQNSSGHNRFGHTLWTYRTGGKIFSSPLLYRNLVLFGGDDNIFYALDTATGKPAWKFKTGGALNGTPAVYRDQVFFTSYDGNFYAIDVRSGKLQWKFQTHGEKKVGAKGLWNMKPVNEYMDDPFDFFLSTPAVDAANGLICFGSGDGNLYALRITDGVQQWRFPTGGIVHTSPILYQNTLYFGSWDRNLYAVDSRTGKEKWRFQTGEDTAYYHLLQGIQASPLIYGSHIFFGARDGYFYALDVETGQLGWKYSAKNSWILTTATVADNVIYTGTSDTYLMLGLDATTGKEKFRSAANGYVYSSPVIAGNTIYFGDFTGQLLAVELSTGKIIDRFETPGRRKNAPLILNNGKLDFAYMTRGMDLAEYTTTVAGMNRLYTLGPILSKPAFGNGVIYFGSADGYLYAVRLL